MGICYSGSDKEVNEHNDILSQQGFKPVREIVKDKVWQCKDKKYAIKIIRTHKNEDLGQVLKDNYYKLRHKHILKYEYCEQIGQTLYCLMEYIDACNLQDYLKKNTLTVLDYRICRQMLEAVKFCHDLNIMHGDISLKNFILTYSRGYPHIILLDFDFAVYLDQSPYTHIRGTLYYLAPEMFKMPVSYDYRVEIWALGICFYYMFLHYYPFNGKSQTCLIYSILNTNPDVSNLIGEIKTDISAMLSKDPHTRPSIVSLYQSRWLQYN